MTPFRFYFWFIAPEQQQTERILSRGESPSRCPRKLHSNHRERRIVGRRAFREQLARSNDEKQNEQRVV